MANDKPSSRLSQQLSKMIKDRGLSISQAALRVGMNKSTLHNYCNGILPRNIDSLLRLAQFLDTTLDQLLLEPQDETDKALPPQCNQSEFIAGEYIVSIRKVRGKNGHS